MDRRQRKLLQLLSLVALLSCARGQCPQGWRENEGRCYFFSIDLKTWMEANAFCLEQNSNLMSIQDIHERLWVRTQISTEIYWIGLNDRVIEGVWEWTDGTPYLEYIAYWAPGQPDNWGEDGEHCGQVLGYNYGKWNDENCNVRRKYICKHINPDPAPRCDLANGWTQYGSNCYKLKAETSRSWSAARHDCVDEGGDLVSITSLAEQNYITGILDSSQFDLWIGLSTLKCTKISCKVEPGNTQFTWSDANTGTYTNWAADEPTIGDAQVGSCSTIIKDETDEFAKWKTHVCRYERPYMCKRPLNTICPAGWRSFGGNCYWLFSNINLLTSWHEAATMCSDWGTNLLIIDSEEEQYFINGILPDFHQVDIPDIWIGLSDKDQDGQFKWVDKSDVTFSNYGSGWPRNTPNMLDCGQIFTGNYEGKWETTNCFKRLGYICEMKGGQNPKPTSAPDSHCDPGYLLYGDFCYHFETESVKTWHDAEAYCVSSQGHLASFHSEAELSFLTGHMPTQAWVGLNDINEENVFVYSDGTPADFLPWAPNQPDNWQNNEDCVLIRGAGHYESGKLNDDFCTATKEFICKKAKGQGPPPPPTSEPGWNEKCGFWMSDPFNDYCYLFNYLSMRRWSDARADCVNQGGDLVSITEPFEQAFIQGIIQQGFTGISLWMGGHDSITEGGWEWTDGSPFRYVHWNAGNPDDYYGEDCLSILINNGYWNDDNCDYNRGYICKRSGNTPKPPPPHDGFMTALVCQDSSAVLHCPEESVINIQSAFYGRDSDDICPHLDGSGGGSCTVEGIFPYYRKSCDNRPYCFLYAHVDVDPCPTVAKYLKVVYSCEQKVCLHGLGVEAGNITDAQLSASSSSGSFTPDKARLNGNSCWMPSGNPTSSWIQANLGQTRKVTGIVIQGCPQNDHWVTRFKLQHSMDGADWSDYVDDGESLPGSTDRNTPDTQLLGTPVSAKYVRIIPVEFSGQTGLRFDILGCSPDYAVTCEHKPIFDSYHDKMTVHCPARCANTNYLVYGTGKYRGDSNTCAAAIHAGVILNEVGGDCTMVKMDGLDFYPGSTRNGITSRQYSGAYEVSYTFADGELRCPGYDWHEFGEFCYKPFDDRKTWHDAQATCRSVGAELVSILSMAEQSWLESYLYMATVDVWTGLNDLFLSGFFVWSDEHEVTFTHWSPGEPNNHLGFDEDCVELFHYSGRWNDKSCKELNTFICKMPKAHYPLPSPIPTVYGCPQGWSAYAYSCYWMEETPRSWSDAKEFCEGKEGVLLHIGDIYEQSHFTVELSGKTGFWWIGLRAQGQGGGLDYQWVNGAPLTFTHWDRDQPDSGDGTCVAMTSGVIGGFWDDKQCLEEFAFFCEKPRPDITPPTKPPTPPQPQGCSEGWSGLPHHRYCYKLFHNVDWSMKKSWGGALADCVARGANLVSIHGQEEENFLSEYTKGTSKWIGLKHNPTEGGYSWSDGSPLSHTNWGPGEPNNHEGREDCVELMTNTDGTHSWWNDINCDAHQDWICMIPKGQNPIVPPVTPPPVPAPDCGTNPGWRKNNGICYYYNDTDVVDFHTATERCWAEKANLVSILTRDEQAYVNSMVGTGQLAEAWIGLVMFGIAGGQHRWVDSSPVTYTHWGPGEPNNYNGEEFCVHMKRLRGDWNDVNCGWDSAGYVCKKFPGDIVTPPPPTQPWEGYCPSGWLRFKNKCFIFKGKKDDIKANWDNARTWCKDQGGELAVIDDEYENDFVSSYLRDLEFPAWIGLSDRITENQFGWSDGVSAVKYTNWNTNEPNNAGGVEHCVAMTHSYLVSGKWNDDACHKENSFVCYMKKSSSIDPPPPTTSPVSGYTPWYSNFYRLVAEPKTWDDAQKFCETEGGNLASIDMSYDQAFLALLFLQGNDDAWIGLRRQEEGVYTWTDGWPVFFTQWGPGEPTNNKDEGCVSMDRSLTFRGTWNDTRCDLAKPFLCKISVEKPPPTPAPGDGKCLPFWTPYGSYCYFVYDGQQGYSWPDSRHYCQSIRAELTSIHSRAEVNFIRSLNHTKHHNVWIGLTRDNHFGWAWTDNTPVGFVFWAPGEPNQNFHPGDVSQENCVEMYPDGRWNDNNCLQKRGFVCRHRQYYTTGTDGSPIIPTDLITTTTPFTTTVSTITTARPPNNGGVIAGAIVAAIVVFVLIFGLMYYIFNVRGYKLSRLSLPIRRTNTVDVPTFTNPNFSGESDI